MDSSPRRVKFSSSESRASVPVPSPSTNQNQGPVAQNEEQMYMEKLKQLQKYIDPLTRMINERKEDGVDLGKMRSLRDVLMDPNERIPMETLLKCENVLQNLLDESPKTQPQEVRTPDHTSASMLERTTDSSDSESALNLEEERLRLVEELQSYTEVTEYLSQEMAIQFKKLTLGEYQPTLTELKKFKEELLRIAVPAPKNLRIEKKEGKLIARWDQPKFFLPLKYSGWCFEEDKLTGKELEVDRFEDIEEGYHELQNISPIRYYRARVCSIASNGWESSYKTSESAGICKDLGQVFIDEAAKLRPGDEYSVYKGYMKNASPNPEEVAVKIVRGENDREVQMMLQLSHNNIVTYRASGKVEEKMNVGKAIYIAMELCETKTFCELIIDKEMNASECKLALLHVMHGLAAIHEKGILHRDLKPQNILRSLDRRNIKIADFGISKKAESNKSNVTKSAPEIGTEGWGSPEHYNDGATMSAKSDIYSAGLVFAFALSGGKHAHGKEDHAWKTRIIDGKPKYDLSILSCEDVKIAEDIIEKMLERRPESRPTTSDVLGNPIFLGWREKVAISASDELHF